MGEVGVDVEGVAQAATALENLRDALAANVPTIVSMMAEYGSPVSTAVLRQAQSRSVGDAADMRSRARLAQLWEARGVCIGGATVVDIPWSGTALDNADAQAEAQALSDAETESGSDPQASAAAIQAIEQDLRDHLAEGDSNPDGRAWLASFYNTGGPAVARLAATLHDNEPGNEDYQNRFTVLNSADQQTMRTFAQGLAQVDKNGDLTPATVQAIASAPDIWSAAMLVKFGPPGSSWATSEKTSAQNPDGLSMLALLTANVYRDEQNGTVRIPLGGKYVGYDWEDQQQLADTLGNYDPLAALLQADTQNKNAAWQVMGDTSAGAPLAKMLLWNNGDLPGLDARFVRGESSGRDGYPGYFTVSPADRSVPEMSSTIVLGFVPPSLAGSFLDAATSAPRGLTNDSKWSAQAAINIIDNTPSAKDDYQLDPAIQQALTDTAQRYLMDLAITTDTTASSRLVNPAAGPFPAWMIAIQGQGDDNPLSNFLSQIASNRSDLATLDAAAKVTFSNVYAQQQLKTLPAWLANSDADDSMVRLLARIDTAANQNGIDLATDLDEQHEEYNKMLEFAEDSAKFIPVVGETADEYMDPIKSGLDLLGIPTEFSTDNAITTQQVDAQSYARDSTQLHIQMVQGLFSNGAAGLLQQAEEANRKLPPDQQWLHQGQIVLTSANTDDFTEWYHLEAAGRYNLGHLEDLYQSVWQNEGATSSPGAGGPW